MSGQRNHFGEIIRPPAEAAIIRRELRLDGCTQDDLATYLGISQGYVSRILSGALPAPDGLIDQMCEALGLSADNKYSVHSGQ